ncbi:MAG: hypothetical protein PF961_01660 [Planctomycetota bacterium]|jgi:uncharacterized membrane protein|nr:hypothetical protein [Planctomycetota bacterium]
MSALLLIIGIVVALAGGIWFLVEAFKENILWGLGSLLFAPVSLVFLILHFRVAAKPFALQVVGLLIVAASIAMAPGAGGTDMMVP